MLKLSFPPFLVSPSLYIYIAEVIIHHYSFYLHILFIVFPIPPELEYELHEAGIVCLFSLLYPQCLGQNRQLQINEGICGWQDTGSQSCLSADLETCEQITLCGLLPLELC